VVGAHPRAVVVSAREDVLQRLRTALDGTPPPPPRLRLHRTEGEHPPGAAALLDLLATRLVDYSAEVHRSDEDGVADAVDGALRAGAAGVPGGRPVVLAPEGLPSWLDGGVFDVRTDDGLDAHALDRVDGVVTTCAVAIAETGTIVLDAGPGQGRRALSLVPDLHVCVVRAEQVVQTVPEAVGRLEPRRPLTWISGPSATSDIELVRVQGVHGPRRLHVVLVGPSGA
jgi:L-lactate dehydrogenase complex protein LldG